MLDFKSGHLLGLEYTDAEDIELILNTTKSFREILDRPIKKVPTLQGMTVVNLFFEASTRTRISFELAEKRLSADSVNFSSSTSSVKKGETLLDTARNIEAMKIDMVVIRHSSPGAPHFLAQKLDAHIINAGDGAHEHPTQALLDIRTILDHHDSIKGLTVGIVGDVSHSRVALSNIHGLIKMGARVIVCGPATLIPMEIEKLGVEVSYSIDELIPQVDVLNILRIQIERQNSGLFPSLREYHNYFGITRERLEKATKPITIMHPGPINRGVEISSDVADSDHSVILSQVTNGVAVRMAVLYLLAGGGENVAVKKNRSNNAEFKKLPAKLCIKDVHLIDSAEKIDRQGSVIIENGIIRTIENKPPSSFDGEIIASEDGILMPGFYDMHVHLREPGREDEETIRSGGFAAANGGFTGLACMPNTDPAIDSQEVVNSIIEEAESLLVDVHPIAAITQKREGKLLAPIAEMVEAGAVAISDDGSPVMNAEVMRRALEYSKMFGIPVLGHEEDINLSHNRHMHEGYYSTKLGIPGIPSISEEILVARDIMLTEYTGGRFHVCHISTKGAVELVRQAKAKNLAVTCEVTPHHFTLTDQAVESYDTNTKMNPPLRSKEDVEAILIGLKDGTIDAIATDHAPHSIEEKEAEYIYAPFGIIGLETAWGLMHTELIQKGIIDLKGIYNRCVANPRRILNLAVPRIKVGEPANLTFVNNAGPWKFKEFRSFSKSINTPFADYSLHGRQVAVINKGLIFSE